MNENKPVIIVSGMNGQLGSELISIHMSYPKYQFIFMGRDTLDLTSEVAINGCFKKYQPAYFINCAAYTKVDKAEDELEQNTVNNINFASVRRIAANCEEFGATLIQISTDYVFDGNASEPYKEDDPTNPVNYYGYTKMKAEVSSLAETSKVIILRTSWVYSSHGHNFVKTMLRLMNEKQEISVVDDQIGSPTYARDLAVAIMDIIESQKKSYGIFHFTNEGVTTWYEFAMEIKKQAKLSCIIHPIPTEKFPTPAKRPHYSVLDKSKIVDTYYIKLRNWKESLTECLGYLQKIV